MTTQRESASTKVVEASQDRLAQIRERVLSMGQEEATARLVEMLKAEPLSYFEMGALLHRHKKEKWYQGRDFRSFVEHGLREDYDRMSRILRTYQAMTAAGLKDEDADGINFSLMHTLIPILNQGNYGKVQEFLKMARVSTVSMLKAKVRVERGFSTPERKKAKEILGIQPYQYTDFDFICMALRELSKRIPKEWRFEWVLFDTKTENVSCTNEELAKFVGAYASDEVEILATVESQEVSATT